MSPLRGWTHGLLWRTRVCFCPSGSIRSGSRAAAAQPRIASSEGAAADSRRLGHGLVEAADTDPAAPGELVVSAAGFVSGGGQPCIAPNRSISSRAPRTAAAARGITAIRSGFTVIRSGFTVIRSGITAIRSGFTVVRPGITVIRSGITAIRSGFTAIQSGITVNRSGITVIRLGITVIRG